MTNNQPVRGTFWQRIAIRFFTFLLALLFFWLLGFVMKDIGETKGPRYEDFRARYVDKALTERRDALNREVHDLKKKIDRQRERQDLVGESTQGLQNTIDQLLELQKLSMERGVSLGPNEQKTFSDSLDLFLANQERYQSINQVIAELADQRATKQEEVATIDQQVESLQKPARKEYEAARKKHNYKLAGYKLTVLVPVLLISVVLLLSKRGSNYFPIFLAIGLATLAKVAIVMHEHFPLRLFKYILIVAFIVAVLWALVVLIRRAVKPRKEAVLKQYREAYEAFFCPICEFPIRRGPMEFLFWNRRTIKRLGGGPPAESETGPYTCPSCATPLFHTCASCGKVRHTLLPACQHCGHEATHRDDAA